MHIYIYIYIYRAIYRMRARERELRQDELLTEFDAKLRQQEELTS